MYWSRFCVLWIVLYLAYGCLYKSVMIKAALHLSSEDYFQRADVSLSVMLLSLETDGCLQEAEADFHKTAE